MKIGIAGSGMIVSYVLDVWKNFEDIEVTAIWCREQNIDTASDIAKEYSIANVYTDYNEFLNDDSFDFVYIGLVNSLHYEYSKAALNARKSVVCEKPFTSTGEQAKELLECAKQNNVFVFESCLPWYSDNYEEVKRLLPEIGEVKLIECSFSQYSRRYESYLNGDILPVFDPSLDGGALYDLGVYSVHFIMGLVGIPKDVQYFPNIGFNGIDTSGVLVMNYDGFKGVCMTAKDCSAPSRCVIEGNKGCIVIDSHPGEIKNITLRMNGESPVNKDIIEFSEGFKYIYEKIIAITKANDYKKCYEMMDKVIDVMNVMEDARKGAGIKFSCD
ncbi:Gfo/Idh/MocA family protein [Breznakia pachnodae]|uniref:Dehydrogenase n=1 Tax=Breznakia pachnodae TaxID=265178 RepID=A0ABU0E455_9FIRM|nr:Gfo/Idh/MocA family oxidoreductase [Breznakia pachnodae]MDQ0361478.1 putative dehydrogenase [Breznakia pachnodae]